MALLLTKTIVGHPLLSRFPRKLTIRNMTAFSNCSGTHKMLPSKVLTSISKNRTVHPAVKFLMVLCWDQSDSLAKIPLWLIQGPRKCTFSAERTVYVFNNDKSIHANFRNACPDRDMGLVRIDHRWWEPRFIEWVTSVTFFDLLNNNFDPDYDQITNFQVWCTHFLVSIYGWLEHPFYLFDYKHQGNQGFTLVLFFLLPLISIYVQIKF